MNIHPIFVHFPIALLSIYAIIEILPLKRLLPVVPWNIIRDFLLYVGALSILPTVVTGLMAGQIMGASPILEVHERAAFTTSAIFLITAVLSIVWRKGEESLTKEITFKVLALLGFIGLFVTGALGAAMVYGTGNDPIVSLVTWIFGLR